MATIENFLQQGVKQVRKSIRDIDDSYNNDWDILAELTQNSIDAIRLSNTKNGEIYLKIDCQNKSISIKDNGVGINPEKLPTLLAPFATDKDDDENSVGEKGVGLTFVMFSCNDFYIKSSSKEGTSEGRVIDANNWKNQTNGNQLPLINSKLDKENIGTEIVLKKVVDCNIFNLSFKQLVYLLRTRTSIGSTNTIWDNEINLKITLEYINNDGIATIEDVPFKFWLPTENIGKKGIIDVEEFYEYIKVDRTDQDKRIKLKDRIIFKKKIFEYNGRTVKAYACFVPKRKTFNDLTNHFEIATIQQLENDEFMDKYNYVTFNSGIYTSVKGMPTGITIDHPITGASGAWPQIYMIFEDRSLKFDIGRKSIHGMIGRIYKKFAREIFSEFQRLSKYISGEVIIDSEYQKEEIFAEIDKLMNLSNKDIKHIKTPREQEASVAAIFFECIGNGKITGINPLIAGYKNKYDLYALWGNKKVVIEFKSHLSYILKDFTDEMKLFNEVDCIVCWDVTETDYEQIHSKGMSIDEIEDSVLPGTQSTSFPSATHRLTLSGLVSPVFVIDLKLMLSKK